ncbi:MAG: S8/S53 family peptidase [Flavobacteriales bacterium]
MKYSKFILFSLFFICSFSFVSAQTNRSVTTNLFIKEFKQLTQLNDVPPAFVAKYDLVKINGEYTIGVLGLVMPSFDDSVLEQMGVKNDTKLGDLYSFRVPLGAFENFINLPGLRFIDISETASPYLNESVPSARVDSVHMGLGGLVRAYHGAGVIIAVIDWGFDYTHPNFYDTTMTYLRISRAWDQNKLSGPPPTGYSFGTEYLGEAALLAAQHDTLYTFGPISHGTHVGGIAGGNGAGTDYVGAAPCSELIFISLKRDSPSLIDAYSYVSNYAASVNKPFVINMSFGLHLGPHDGSLLPNVAIDAIQGPGKVFVASAGNNGSAAFHIDRDFNGAVPQDTLKTVVGFGNVADQFGQTLSIWGSPNSSFHASLILADNMHNTIYQTPFYNTQNSPSINEINIINGDTLHLILEGMNKDFLSERPQIQMEIKNKTGLKAILVLTSVNSHVHAWNTIRLNNRYTNWGVAFASNYPGATAGDINYGIGEPGGCGKGVITVGSYLAERVLANGNIVFGNISSFTSRGPTVDERVKPDISSTGQNVISSINSFDVSETSGFTTTVQWNGNTYAFKSYSGTSMSGPMVAGIVALMLESFPTLSAAQAKDILKTTARLDQHTGQIGINGTNDWGWGKANALAAVKAATILSSIKEIQLVDSYYNLYPNPAQNQVTLDNSQHPLNESVSLEIYTLNGRLVKQLIIPSYTPTYVLSLDDFSNGMYLLQFRTNKAIFFNKLMVNK